MALPALMVVGEDISFRYLIQRYADKCACRVVFVDVSEDIPNLVLQQAPEVVMIELGFPSAEGKAVLEALKTHPATQEIPVIICSWSQEAEWSLEDGATVYLQKPILYDDFRAALSDVENGQRS